jgi:hypothetical protein
MLIQNESKILHFFGFQFGMLFSDHASSGLSRKAKRLDSPEWRGTLLHALLNAFLHLSFLLIFLSLSNWPQKGLT